MEVYLDVVFIENAIIDLFLILVTLRLLRLKYRKGGIYIAAIIGGIYGLTPIVDSVVLSNAFLKVIFAIVMIVLSLKEKVLRNIFKATVMFFMLSFTMCGVMFISLLSSSTYTISGGMNTSNYSIRWVMISLLFVGVIAIRVYDTIKERAVIDNFIYDIYIKNDEKILMLKGFLDTGNELREPITNLPCILIEDEYLLQLELKKEDEYFIRYKTIDSSDILHGFRSDFIKIKGKDDSAWREIDAIVCGCKTILSKENDYQVLLSRGII